MEASTKTCSLTRPLALTIDADDTPAIATLVDRVRSIEICPAWLKWQLEMVHAPNYRKSPLARRDEPAPGERADQSFALCFFSRAATSAHSLRHASCSSQ